MSGIVTKVIVIILTGIFSITIYTFFVISNNVGELRKKASTMSNEIKQRREIIHILKAEWAYLSNPIRMEDMIKQS